MSSHNHDDAESELSMKIRSLDTDANHETSKNKHDIVVEEGSRDFRWAHDAE